MFDSFSVVEKLDTGFHRRTFVPMQNQNRYVTIGFVFELLYRILRSRPKPTFPIIRCTQFKLCNCMQRKNKIHTRSFFLRIMRLSFGVQALLIFISHAPSLCRPILSLYLFILQFELKVTLLLSLPLSLSPIISCLCALKCTPNFLHEYWNW